MKKNNKLYNNLNNKWFITALGVAALGVQLVQTTDVKADDTSKDNTSSEQVNSTNVPAASIADNSAIADSGNSADASVSQNDASNDAPASSKAADADTDSSDTSTSASDTTNIPESNDTADDQKQNDQSDLSSTNSNSATVSDSKEDSTTNNDTVTVNDPKKVLLENSTGKPIDYSNPVKAAASITATDGTNTATSKDTDEYSDSLVKSSWNTQSDAHILTDSKATLTAIFTITNTSDEDQSNYTTRFLLPNYQALGNSNFVMSNDTDLTSFISGLPSGATVTYAIDGNNEFSSIDQLVKNDANFSLNDIREILVDSAGTSLAAGQVITATVPLTSKTTDDTLYNYVGIYTGSPYRQARLWFNTTDLSKNITNVSGQYSAVVTTDSGNTYVAADKDIQDKMPSYTTGSDMQTTNPVDRKLVNADQTVWAYKNKLTVDLVNSDITSTANQNGYSMLLDKDGAQQTQYSYTNDGTGESTPEIYMRQVINASDSTTKVGADWTASDNLTSVLDNSDQTLTGSDAINSVSTTITDNDGVLNNGKVAKAGAFTVEYTYQLKDGTAITKTVTVTADPTDKTNTGTDSNTSSNSNSSHHASSSSNSSTDSLDPVVSPNTPDDINKVDRLVSTHPAEGDVTLYKLDTTAVQNRALHSATDWFSDEEMTFAGETYYRVATNEWVKAPSVYVYENKNLVIRTDSTQSLINSEGKVVANRALNADSAWRTDRIAYINGKTYYRVATNEFVATDAVSII